MVSKQRAKFVKSLKLKKYRKKANAFLVEGTKNVIELIDSDYEISCLFLTDKFLKNYSDLDISGYEVIICNEKELADLGTFQTNEYAIAVARMKDFKPDLSQNRLVLALDNIGDPGNLGTIIRIADWYGLKSIIASENTADFYNPKVINASMGSFTRVHVNYLDLPKFLSEHTSHRIYGAFLQGENVHTIKFEFPAILVMGNETTGISNSLKDHIQQKITIPKIGGAESLNVAVSTAIICDNMLRD